MIAALIILAAMVATGVLLWLLDRRHPQADAPAAAGEERREREERVEAQQEECCGMHITCEKDSLLTAMAKEIEYYDDEELDAYRGTAADSYTADAIEQFRDVLLTLRPEEIAPWARSIQLRGIELPSPVRDELLMIVAEARRTKHDTDGELS